MWSCFFYEEETEEEIRRFNMTRLIEVMERRPEMKECILEMLEQRRRKMY